MLVWEYDTRFIFAAQDVPFFRGSDVVNGDGIAINFVLYFYGVFKENFSA